MLTKLFTWVMLALACNYIIKLVLLMDWNKRIYGHYPGPCQTIKGIEFGADALEVLNNELVLVSSGLRSKYGDPTEQKHVRGRIFVVTLSKGQENKRPKAKELEIHSDTLDKTKFNPHGISAWTSPDGYVNVYIINHKEDGDAVECFTFKNRYGLLIHQRTITDPLIYNANDIQATGPERFYLTNSHYFKDGLMQKAEMLTMSSLGSVVYYDGKKARLVDQWLQGPNGITINLNKTNLYVALPLQEQIRVYEIQRDDSLVKVADMSLLSSPDNIWHENGTDEIWAGCHPVAHEAFIHIGKPKSKTSPAQVLRVRPGHGHASWTISEPYADDGRILSGSSSAVYVNENLLIGTMHHKLMWCPVPDRDLL